MLLLWQQTRDGSAALSREFADAATTLQGLNTPSTLLLLRLAAVDAADTRGSVTLPVAGLPTLVLFNCPIGNISIVQSEIRGCDSGVSVYSGGRSSAELQRFLLSVPPAPKLSMNTSAASLVSSTADQGAVQWISTRESLLQLVNNTALLVLLVTDAVDSAAVADFGVIALTDSAAVSSASASTSLGTSTPASVRYCASTDGSLLDDDQERAVRPTVVLFREFGRSRVALPSQIIVSTTSGNDSLAVAPSVISGYAWNATVAAAFVRSNRFSLISKYVGGAFANYYYDRSATGHVLLLANTSDAYFSALEREVESLTAIFDARSSTNASASLLTVAASSSLVVRFLVISTESERELCNAHAVVDNAHVPALLLVRNISQPAVRFSLDGRALLAEIIETPSINSTTSSSFLSRAAAFLEDSLLPVFAPLAPGVADATMSYDEFWEEGFQRWEDPGDGTGYNVDEMTDTNNASINTRRLSVDEYVETDDDDQSHYYFQPKTNEQSRAQIIQTITHVEQLRRYDGDAPLIVVFSTPRCSACRSFAPVFEETAAFFARRHGSLVADGELPVFALANVDQVAGLQTLDGLERLRLLPGVFLFPSRDKMSRSPAPLAMTSASSWTAKKLVSEILDAISEQ